MEQRETKMRCSRGFALICLLLTLGCNGGTSTPVVTPSVEVPPITPSPVPSPPTFIPPTIITGNVYYLSLYGSDTNTGLTEGQAWQTLAKVNSMNFQPGDVIRFQSGSGTHP